MIMKQREAFLCVFLFSAELILFVLWLHEARFYIPCLTVLPIVVIALNSNMTNNNSVGEGKVRIVTAESLRTLADNKRIANVWIPKAQRLNRLLF